LLILLNVEASLTIAGSYAHIWPTRGLATAAMGKKVLGDVTHDPDGVTLIREKFARDAASILGRNCLT